jgi:unsaturated rhamnogalacturonyl hydrolase
MNIIQTQDVAVCAFNKHRSIANLGHYSGILTLEGLARLWQWTRNNVYLETFQQNISPFVSGSLTDVMGAFHLYNVGGSPAALMLRLGVLPEAEKGIYEKAVDLVTNGNRSREGIFSTQTLQDNQPHRIWIDAAFAVCPFLCNAGIYFQKEEWINESVEQIVLLIQVLKDPQNGLCHQARGFCGKWPGTEPDKISEDHWSRGNGWGLFALAELMQDLPDNHPRRNETETLFLDLLHACLRYQNEQGLWHQEITEPDSYTETSGSGLILYALGVALEKNLVPENQKETLVRGLKGYTGYIAIDGSVHHCCGPCNSPGNGTMEEYKAVKHKMNDSHAFGPVILAFGQAAKIGIHEF